MTALAYATRRVEASPRVYVNWPAFWHDEDAVRPREHKLYLGSSGACYDSCCRRQICDEACYPWPRLSLLAPYLTAIAHGCDSRAIDHPDLLTRRPPLYFDKPVFGELVYVDLRRAYWSIYSRTTLDVAYDGKRSPQVGSITFDDIEELGEDKLLRNALVGTLRREWTHGLDHGVPFREEVTPAKRRPNLWGLIMDCLEVVAVAMRHLGAVYVHTDGFIFPHRDLAAYAIDWLWSHYHLIGEVRLAGEGAVWGLGRFAIGETVEGMMHEDHMPVDSLWARMDPQLTQALTEWLYHASVLEVIPTTD